MLKIFRAQVIHEASVHRRPLSLPMLACRSALVKPYDVWLTEYKTRYWPMLFVSSGARKNTTLIE